MLAAMSWTYIDAYCTNPGAIEVPKEAKIAWGGAREVMQGSVGLGVRYSHGACRAVAVPQFRSQGNASGLTAQQIFPDSPAYSRSAVAVGLAIGAARHASFQR